MSKPEWKCPKCSAPHGKHGNGGGAKCQARTTRMCGGFYCDCDYETADGHGESHADPCQMATCDHCGWMGTFPIPLFDEKKLKGWAKTAWAAGWRPPEWWTP